MPSRCHGHPSGRRRKPSPCHTLRCSCSKPLRIVITIAIVDVIVMTSVVLILITTVNMVIIVVIVDIVSNPLRVWRWVCALCLQPLVVSKTSCQIEVASRLT